MGENVQLGIGVIINRDIKVASEISIPSGITIVKDVTQGEKVKIKKTINKYV